MAEREMARGRRRTARDYSQIVNGYGDESLEQQKRLVRLGRIVRQFGRLRRREERKSEDYDDNHIITIINKTLRRLNKMQKKFHEAEDDSEETKQAKLRINSKILRRLNDKLKLHEQSQQQDDGEAQKKQMTNKILGRLSKLLDIESYGDLDGPYEGSIVCYDRQSTTNCYSPEDVERLVHSANLAIDFFNKTSDIIYSVVDVVYATKSLVAGYNLNLTFTAKHDGDEDPKTFRARIFYGIKKPPEILEVILLEDEIDKEKWKMPEEVEEEFWGYEDLECEYDDVTSSLSTSPHNSISITRSCIEKTNPNLVLN